MTNKALSTENCNTSLKIAATNFAAVRAAEVTMAPPDATASEEVLALLGAAPGQRHLQRWVRDSIRGAAEAYYHAAPGRPRWHPGGTGSTPECYHAAAQLWQSQQYRRARAVVGRAFRLWHAAAQLWQPYRRGSGRAVGGRAGSVTPRRRRPAVSP